MSTRQLIPLWGVFAAAPGSCTGSIPSAAPLLRAERPTLVRQAIAETLSYRTGYFNFGGGVLQVDTQELAWDGCYPGWP